MQIYFSETMVCQCIQEIFRRFNGTDDDADMDRGNLIKQNDAAFLWFEVHGMKQVIDAIMAINVLDEQARSKYIRIQNMLTAALKRAEELYELHEKQTAN